MFQYLLLVSTVSGFLFSTSNIGCNCPPPSTVPLCPQQQCPPQPSCSASVVAQAEADITFKPENVEWMRNSKDFGPVTVVETDSDDYYTSNKADEDKDVIYKNDDVNKRLRRQNSANEPKAASDGSDTTGKSDSVSDSVDKPDDVKCNSNTLKNLMLENISSTSSGSKRKINQRAEELFGGSVDVICSKGHFSYIYSSNLYCETTKNNITCIAFRQAN